MLGGYTPIIEGIKTRGTKEGDREPVPHLFKKMVGMDKETFEGL